MPWPLGAELPCKVFVLHARCPFLLGDTLDLRGSGFPAHAQAFDLNSGTIGRAALLIDHTLHAAHNDRDMLGIQFQIFPYAALDALFADISGHPRLYRLAAIDDTGGHNR